MTTQRQSHTRCARMFCESVINKTFKNGFIVSIHASSISNCEGDKNEQIKRSSSISGVFLLGSCNSVFSVGFWNGLARQMKVGSCVLALWAAWRLQDRHLFLLGAKMTQTRRRELLGDPCGKTKFLIKFTFATERHKTTNRTPIVENEAIVVYHLDALWAHEPHSS